MMMAVLLIHMGKTSLNTLKKHGEPGYEPGWHGFSAPWLSTMMYHQENPKSPLHAGTKERQS